MVMPYVELARPRSSTKKELNYTARMPMTVERIATEPVNLTISSPEACLGVPRFRRQLGDIVWYVGCRYTAVDVTREDDMRFDAGKPQCWKTTAGNSDTTTWLPNHQWQVLYSCALRELGRLPLFHPVAVASSSCSCVMWRSLSHSRAV
jgi:hypothetical protein